MVRAKTAAEVTADWRKKHKKRDATYKKMYNQEMKELNKRRVGNEK